MSNFDRVRIKCRKVPRGMTWEVVKETHKAGNWDGPPSEVEVIADRLTRTEALDRAIKERDVPSKKPNPYGGYY